MTRLESPVRVLIVAHQTAASPGLLAAVAERAAEGPCCSPCWFPPQRMAFTGSSIPRITGCRRRIGGSMRPFPVSTAAGAEVMGVVGSHDPLGAVQDALHLLGSDEVIVSTLPARPSRWLRLDLPHKIRGLRVPVTEVIGGERAASPLSAA